MLTDYILCSRRVGWGWSHYRGRDGNVSHDFFRPSSGSSIWSPEIVGGTGGGSGTAATLQSLRIHALNVSSDRFAAARHIFTSRGLSRRCTLIERGVATTRSLPGRFTVVNTMCYVLPISNL